MPEARPNIRPSAGGSRRSSALCGSIDIAPTLLDLTGLSAPETRGWRMIAGSIGTMAVEITA